VIKMEDTLKEELKSVKFIVTADVIPPKGTEYYKCLKGIELLKGRVAAINVADMPGANMRMGSLAICLKIKDMGIDPILQVTCRDRNRISLQSEMLSAYAMGIRNILCLRGDDPAGSDNPNTRAVFDLDTIGLLKAGRSLEQGFDLGGNRLDGSPKFCLGAALDPGAENQEEEIRRTRLKAEAGAEFFQTQPIFDVGLSSRFLEEVSFLDIPVLAGIFILKSAASARFINKNIPGISVPPWVIQELEKSDPEKRSIEIAARLVKELSNVSSGVHIMMTVPWHYRIPDILEEAGIGNEGN
jgi:5,10-methylenetetrahydrofolate reductase